MPLPQCTAALDGCWQLLQGKGFVVVRNILSANMLTLTKLCQQAKYRDNAASLMSQTKILQGVVAIHKLDYAYRETSCLEAVQYGEMTKDHRIHAAALMYLAYTYTYCYPRIPEKAVQLFGKALKLLDSEAYLLESDICMGMAGAYAQYKEEAEALKIIERSKMAMPPILVQDPSHFYADCALSDCYQWEGRMYTDLAFHFPAKRKDYAQKAYDALLLSSSLGAPSKRHESETAIHRANAARGIGDLHEYIKCLKTGLRIAVEIDSMMRYNEAFAVLRKAPEEWKKERKYKNLVKLFVSRGEHNDRLYPRSNLNEFGRSSTKDC
jgi:hypothetical protein